MIRSFRSKALKRFWTKSDASGLRPDWARRVERRLTLLNEATRPDDMDLVTYGFHALKGSRDRYAVTVSRNWRLTFAFDAQDAIDVDLEDYHGR
jgi:proteic killer suppression protein